MAESEFLRPSWGRSTGCLHVTGVQEKIVEVPVVKYVDRVVEVPHHVIKENFVEVDEIIRQEKIIPVPKVEFVEKIVKQPKIVTVEKYIDVPRIEYRKVSKKPDSVDLVGKRCPGTQLKTATLAEEFYGQHGSVVYSARRWRLRKLWRCRNFR